MRTQDELRARRAYFEECVHGWAEPGGLLLPTEPDAEERARVRLRLFTAIRVLTWALGESETP